MSPVRSVARSLVATVLTVIVLSGLAVWAGVLLKLTVAGAIALYFVVWWTVLFAVLPFGVRSQAEAGTVVEGTEPGAPHAPGLRDKMLWTTIASAILFVGIAGLFPLSGL